MTVLGADQLNTDPLCCLNNGLKRHKKQKSMTQTRLRWRLLTNRHALCADGSAEGNLA